VEPSPTAPPSPSRRPGPESGPWWAYPAVFLGLLAVGVALGEAIDVDRESGPGSLDRRAWAWVRDHRDAWPGVTRLARSVTRLGDVEAGPLLVAAVALALAAAWRWGVAGVGRWDAWFWVGATVGGRLLSVLLKSWFRRDRPPTAYQLVHETSFSFPSGHSLSATAFVTLLAVLLARACPGRFVAPRRAAIGSCVLLAALVAASRVWLGVHYLTDVLVGLVLGPAWALAAAAIHFGWTRRRDRTDDGAPPPGPV
jgi:membrane-associated phospholipid phosphatase